ncbi:MAG: ankyrin repeat domain-containing protein, partial [Planctomycetota bacterium]
MIRGGAIPITFETRTILETFFAHRPLIVFDDSRDEATSQEVESLLTWLRTAGIGVGRKAEFSGGDVWAIAFVREIFALADSGTINPYRRLDHYLPDDAHHYRGREQEQRRVGDWLNQRMSGDTSMLRISGPSGVGKSSFMNARIAPLAKEAGLTYVTFRPTDLRIGQSGHQSPIRAFCSLLGPIIGRTSIDDPAIAFHNPNLARVAALEWIGKAVSPDLRFVLAIDQFEEIVDNLANDWNANAWKGLLDLICDLSDQLSIPVVMTLESGRRQALVDTLPETLFSRATEIDLSDDDESFLKTIITEPFADAGFKLGEDVLKRLLEEVKNLQSSVGMETSALPLLALKLHALFDQVTRNPAFAAKSSQVPFGNEGNALTLEDLKHTSLGIAEEIRNLAEEAWTESGGGTLHDLAAFLRPFIRVVTPAEGDDEMAGKGRMVLQTVPARRISSVMERQSAFQRRRLIVPSRGGFRLAHEAVIRRWPLAADWYEKERDSIMRLDRFVQSIIEWEHNGRPSVAEASEDEIALAVYLLWSHITDWSSRSLKALSTTDRTYREYAMALFGRTALPTEIVEGTPFGTQYVHVAAAYGMTALLQRMIATEPDAVNSKRKDGQTPIMAAAWSHVDAVATLLDQSADPTQPDINGFTAIDYAIWGENDEVFDILLPYSDPERNPLERGDPLYSAARRGRLDMIYKLEARGFRHDQRTKNNLTALFGATINGDPELFDYCLSKGDPTLRCNTGESILDFIVLDGKMDLLAKLLGHSDGESCLQGVAPNGMTPLMHAAWGHQTRSIEFLLAAGLDVNATVEEGGGIGQTALHFALRWLGSLDEQAPQFVADRTYSTVKALLSSKAIDVGIIDGQERTPYSMARHHRQIQKLLIDHPTFRPATLPAGVPTPLDMAVKAENLEKIHTLLEEPRHIEVAQNAAAALLR